MSSYHAQQSRRGSVRRRKAIEWRQFCQRKRRCEWRDPFRLIRERLKWAEARTRS